MTLPNERLRALVQAKRFLRELALNLRKRTMKEWRTEAGWRLRHYPGDYEILKLAKRSPDLLDESGYEEDTLYEVIQPKEATMAKATKKVSSKKAKAKTPNTKAKRSSK